ncbi:hypothetical protein CHELA40_60008 [Chelatococcus asaccharovorans]|nr:hypothetical protein CHELA17_30034 [Chelatococcus asaccharovorans]CAH1695090.1 hypothetical protein CHELA40_60008 [Chelatococcus asaccharovorans]
MPFIKSINLTYDAIMWLILVSGQSAESAICHAGGNRREGTLRLDRSNLQRRRGATESHQSVLDDPGAWPRFA